jgi:hypothetical protein
MCWIHIFCTQNAFDYSGIVCLPGLQTHSVDFAPQWALNPDPRKAPDWEENQKSHCNPDVQYA